MTQLFKKKVNIRDLCYRMPDGEYRNRVIQICNNAGINNVELYFAPRRIILGINGFAQAKLFGDNTLVLTEDCIELDFDMVAAIVGHEAIHLKYKDGTILSSVRRIMAFSGIVILFFSYVALIDAISKILPLVGNILTVVSLPFMVLFELGLIIFLLVDNRRYWYQIQELKADRLSCSIEGVSRKGMLKLLWELRKMEKSWFTELPWYKKMYIRYFDFEAHPCSKRRIKLIEKYQDWSIRDYAYHLGVMIKWFFTFRGWTGI